ncbi:MAG TPA: YkoF family thiamine/hydroxymethylpyrimidine-binding protein [Balneolales bacterium]|nr:YkoF family thiamine/hydroxymethylpyrimidine-binding protein [Balneolales bacterium]
MTCQIAYLPFGENDTIKEVEDVLKLITQYNVKPEVHELSTTVTGGNDEIFKMLQELYTYKSKEGKLFRLHVEMLHVPNN